MKTLLAMLAVLIRLVRPACGVHTSPLGYFRELAGEARRRRARRVRRYAQDLPVLAEAEPGEEDVPVVPAPRRPADDALPSVLGEWPGPVTEADAAVVAEDRVRSYYRAWEHQRRFLHLDRSRLGLAVLMDLAESESEAGVSA